MSRLRSSADLTDVVSSLAGRRVRIGEIIAALDIGRSTYYEQRDDGRLLSADNLLQIAGALGLNPVELLVRCGSVGHQAAVDYVTAAGGDVTAAEGGVPAATESARRGRRRPRLQPRMDYPPL